MTAFTSEVEKARWKAISRAKSRANELGANAIIGIDVETSDLGLQSGIADTPLGVSFIQTRLNR